MPILQDHLPHMPWMAAHTARFPGIQPMEPGDWLRVDEAFAGQMALRDQLIADKPQDIHAAIPGSDPAQAELLNLVLAEITGRPGYNVTPDQVTRPDGVTVPVNRAAPLLTLGRLVQEDFAIHQPMGDEHGMTAAILCFPASWTLAQKIGKPLTGIHKPVQVYDADLARRVQRLFHAIRPGNGMWRANALLYEDPSLHHPLREGETRPKPQSRNYLRSERQCLVRLPDTQAVVFSIHTTIVHIDNVPAEALAEFLKLHP